MLPSGRPASGAETSHSQPAIVIAASSGDRNSQAGRIWSLPVEATRGLPGRVAPVARWSYGSVTQTERGALRQGPLGATRLWTPFG